MKKNFLKRWHLISAMFPIIVNDEVEKPLPSYEVIVEPRLVDGFQVDVPIRREITPCIDTTCVDDLSIENLQKLGIPLSPSSSTFVPDGLQSVDMMNASADVIDDNVIVPLTPSENETINQEP